MKLRIKGNTLRLRLQQKEVKRLLDAGVIREETCFGPVTFSYELAVRNELPLICAELDGHAMRVLLPAEVARHWVTSDEVSLYGEQPLSANSADVLKILVEKDFVCIKPRTSPLWEDESDAYPNPNPTCGGK
ncbi:MAG: hypothetical protein RIQ81_1152 [Pseudomonadota bacterium]|jgi:hypothetical protein